MLRACAHSACKYSTAAKCTRLRQCNGCYHCNAKSLPDSAMWGEQHYLDKSGRWGMMEEGRWKAFVEWLDESGLLRDKVRLESA